MVVVPCYCAYIRCLDLACCCPHPSLRATFSRREKEKLVSLRANFSPGEKEKLVLVPSCAGTMGLLLFS